MDGFPDDMRSLYFEPEFVELRETGLTKIKYLMRFRVREAAREMVSKGASSKLRSTGRPGDLVLDAPFGRCRRSRRPMSRRFPGVEVASTPITVLFMTISQPRSD